MLSRVRITSCLLIAVAISVLHVETRGADRLPNLGDLKNQIKDYHDCIVATACYATDLEVEAERGIQYLTKRVAAKKSTEKLAVVLDIDETALSNYGYYLATDFGYEPSRFDIWVQSATAPAIPATLKFFKAARASGVPVFFITGRHFEQRFATEQNLSRAGYDGWTELFMRERPDFKTTTVDYKSGKRKIITDRGYTIIINMGDQETDLKGDPTGELSIKLANPMYVIN